jgi:DNA methylase
LGLSGRERFPLGRAAELAMHPTVKPVALIADAIRDVTNRGDLILDPFGGAGRPGLGEYVTRAGAWRGGATGRLRSRLR